MVLRSWFTDFNFEALCKPISCFSYFNTQALVAAFVCDAHICQVEFSSIVVNRSWVFISSHSYSV